VYQLNQILNRPVGVNGRKWLNRHSAAAVLREIDQLNPEVIILCGARGCVEVTLEILYWVWSDGHLKRLCMYHLTVPRRGWVVLVLRNYLALTP
jgi:hypothetical protein